ncbi:hypothetical protein COOONC_18025 [Cooperia oncophora]
MQVHGILLVVPKHLHQMLLTFHSQTLTCFERLPFRASVAKQWQSWIHYGVKDHTICMIFGRNRRTTLVTRTLIIRLLFKMRYRQCSRNLLADFRLLEVFLKHLTMPRKQMLTYNKGRQFYLLCLVDLR